MKKTYVYDNQAVKFSGTEAEWKKFIADNEHLVGHEATDESLRQAARVAARHARAVGYPPIGDQLDAVMKWLATVPDLPQELAGIVEACKAVKVKHPIERA
jgi:hypothetical protein